ncbi:MAG: tellurite resistance protein [Proteobacteria bacterium]|nr:MAG: tellurite resistance protein [Pseudomonadota bacterium]
MKALPSGLSFVRKTPEFDENSVPKGLLNAHQTKAGTWGKIVILEGKLQYKINEPEEEIVVLDVDNYGVVEPTILHEVKPLGKVRFHVEFYA